MRSAASPLHRVRLGKDELAVVIDPATGQLLKCAAVTSLMMKAHSQQAPEACSPARSPCLPRRTDLVLN